MLVQMLVNYQAMEKRCYLGAINVRFRNLAYHLCIYTIGLLSLSSVAA